MLDHTGAPLPDAGVNWKVTGYAGASSAFPTVQELVDPTALQPNIVEGLFWKDGGMEPKLNTIAPFKITVPKIIDPSVKQVNVRIAVVNFCDIGKNAANDASGPYAEPKDMFGRKIPQLTTLDAPDQINPADALNYSGEGFLSEPVSGELSISAGKGLKLFPIDSLGNKKAAIATDYAKGRYRIKLDEKNQAHWFVMTVN